MFKLQQQHVGLTGGLPEPERLLDEFVSVHHHVFGCWNCNILKKMCVSLWWQRHFKVLILFFADINMLVSWMMIINSSWLQLSFFWKNGSWKQPLQHFARVSRVLFFYFSAIQVGSVYVLLGLHLSLTHAMYLWKQHITLEMPKWWWMYEKTQQHSMT